MINEIYLTVQTILNKENQGYVSPTEFNRIASLVQMEIFREYFESENRDKNKDNRGMINRGYSNLPFNERQRLSQFAGIANLVYDVPSLAYSLPNELYFIEDNGLTTPAGRVVEEVQRSAVGYLAQSSAASSTTYPIYEMNDGFIKVFPSTITSTLICRYLRIPKNPKWTFVVSGSGVEMFNQGASDYQDFELHISEFSNIVIRIMMYFGVNIREGEVIQIAETLKDKNNIKENN